METIKRLEGHQFFRLIRLGSAIWSGLTIILSIFTYFNLLPGYVVKLHPKNSVQPRLSLFPAQAIRLGFDFYSPTLMSEVGDVTWSFRKMGGKSYDAHGNEPTILIPKDGGGNYELRVEVPVNGEKRTGSITLYVVQDSGKPFAVNISENTTIAASAISFGKELLGEISALGMEVYLGDSQWKQVENVSGSNSTFILKKNTTLPTFDGQAIFRVKGLGTDLSKYGIYSPLRLGTAGTPSSVGVSMEQK